MCVCVCVRERVSATVVGKPVPWCVAGGAPLPRRSSSAGGGCLSGRRTDHKEVLDMALVLRDHGGRAVSSTRSVPGAAARNEAVTVTGRPDAATDHSHHFLPP